MKNAYWLIICCFFKLYLSAQKINIAPKPSWVTTKSFNYSEKILQDDVTKGYTYFLNDYQINAGTHTNYTHYAYKIFNNKGVEDASSLYFYYNPLFQKVILHSLKIIRNNEVKDKLKTSKITDIQREDDLENNIYDGERTVSVIIDDVRSGDIVEYDFSIVGDNPIFENKFFYSFYLNDYNAVKYIYCKLIKPLNISYNIKYLNTKHEPKISKTKDSEILEWEIENVKGVKNEISTPRWYDPYDLVEISEYQNWEEVIAWGKSIFKLSAKMPDALKFKIEELKKLQSKEAQFIQALRYVQDEIRYFGIEMGVNSHKPKSPEEVVVSGYGDCKDKTYLLNTILHQLGIKAAPVLVNTNFKEQLVYHVPSPSQFNHVILSASLNDKLYFVDPTIQSQRGGLHSYYTPNYYTGLLISDSISDLVQIPVKKLSEIKIQESYNLKNIKGEADLIVKTFYTGAEADNSRYQFHNSNLTEIHKKYLKYYEEKYKDVKSVSDFTYKDNELDNIVVSTEYYKIPKIWDRNSEDEGKLKLTFVADIVKEFINEIDISLKERNHPLFLSYPDARQHIIEIQLPEDWNIDYSEKIITNAYFKFENRVTFINHKLKLSYFIKIFKNNVPPQYYQKFKSDLEEVYNNLSYQISWNEKLSKQTADSNVNWILVFVAFLFSIICFIVLIYFFIKLNKQTLDDIVPMRLGGWLILPFVGLIISFFVIIVGVFTNSFFDKSVWILRTDQSGSDYISGFAGVLTFELCANICFIFLILFLIVGFIKNYRIVPKLMIIFYVFNVIFVILDSYLTISIFSDMTFQKIVLNIIKSMVPAAIWIPYFSCSDRVKETFVR